MAEFNFKVLDSSGSFFDPFIKRGIVALSSFEENGITYFLTIPKEMMTRMMVCKLANQHTASFATGKIATFTSSGSVTVD